MLLTLASVVVMVQFILLIPGVLLPPGKLNSAILATVVLLGVSVCGLVAAAIYQRLTGG